MKVRPGFVSNSSSANFIVLWQSRQGDLQKDLEELFQWADLSYIDMIKSYTRPTQSGDYKTIFWTTMYNGVDDFGEAATKLVGAVAMKNRLIDTIMVED